MVTNIEIEEAKKAQVKGQEGGRQRRRESMYYYAIQSFKEETNQASRLTAPVAAAAPAQGGREAQILSVSKYS